MPRFYCMNIPNSALWVFDLDDTLYKEKEYQASGYCAIRDFVQIYFDSDVESVIQYARSHNQDVLESVCTYLRVPSSVKESLLWCYRLHTPNIQLDHVTRDALNFIQDNSKGISILTDGRSVSQRAKIKALGLNNYELYVSEEWGDIKPEATRFKAIMDNNPNVKTFIYVGDNIKKDFITPNKLNWVTIGLKDNGDNIHSQVLHDVQSDFLPDVWINSLKELKSFVC